MSLIQSLIAVTALVGSVGTLLGLIQVFGAMRGESVDPSQKARALGEGIAQAMNCAALVVAVGVTGGVVAAVARLQK